VLYKKFVFYYFVNNYNEIKNINIKIFKNISIILQHHETKDLDQNEILKIKKFCRFNGCDFFITNNIKKASRYKANGVFITSINRNMPSFLTKNNFKIIGSAHNQIEYYFKKKQGCKAIMLSPLFSNQKYTDNSILGISRFNLISLQWKESLIALGGVMKNLNKIKMTRCAGVGFKRFNYKKKAHFDITQSGLFKIKILYS
jgi:thiamine-phosphate pyrophosphorylase